MSEETSLLQEIDDAMRAEKAHQFWQRHGKLLLIGCAGVVALVAASAFWKNHLNEQHIQQTHILLQADTAARDGRFADALKILDEQKEWSPELAAIRNIRSATLHAGMNKAQNAANVTQEAATAGVDNGVKDSATLRLRATIPSTDISQTAASGRAFSSLARQTQAADLLKQGKNKEAAAILKPLIGELQPFSPARTRAEDLLRLTGEAQ